MDCPGIPELAYSEFGKRILENVGNRRVPLSGSIELTFRCNLRCRHCYLDDVHDYGSRQKIDELSTSEWYGVLDQIATEGTLWLLLTGGEPLARRDFADIYRYAKLKGFIVTLFTNGTLVTPEVADLLDDLRPAKVEITLYGYSQATYERVTGVPGSHKRCFEGIELLMARGIPLRLKTMAMTLNKYELPQMQGYAESLGVDFRYDAMLNGGVNGADTPKRLRLSPEEIVHLDERDPKRLASWQEFCTEHLNRPLDPEMLYFCGAGLRSYHIDPSGRLSVCLMSRAQQYSLRTGSFKEGWYAYLDQVRSARRRGPSECSECSLLALCGTCPGWAHMECGNEEARVDFLCEVAHLRAAALGIPVTQDHPYQQRGEA